MILCELLTKFKHLKFWSDGCGKHLKTYSTHYYMCKFQKKVACIVSWDFLAPNRAHNRCDAAAARWKGKIDSMIRDFYSLSSVAHLAFAVSSLANSFMIKIATSLPDVIQVKFTDESFMRDSFRFEYSPPYQSIEKCKHKCYGSGCGHICCNRSDEIECVDLVVLNRDGSKSIQTLRSVDYCSKESEEKNNAICDFWGSESSLRRLIPSEKVRITKVGHLQDSTNSQFNWQEISYDDEECSNYSDNIS